MCKKINNAAHDIAQAPDTTAGGERQLGSVTRRGFLRGILAATGTGVLAACAPGGAVERPFAGPYNTATPARVLASPRAPEVIQGLGEGTPTPQASATPSADGLALDQFLALSAVLTGVNNLDPVLGRTYLQSLQASDQFNVTLADLYQQAGFDSDNPPESVAALEGQGFFEGQAAEGGPVALADKIIEYWYTGVYTTAEGEQAVATYVDALAWKTLHFTKPNSVCGSPGFWEDRPEVTVPRD